MLGRCFDEKNHKRLYDHVRGLRGQVGLCAFPNVFITIAPAEWTFPRPYWLDPYDKVIFAMAYIMALHMYFLVRCIWLFLCNPWGHRWFVVYEWVMKTEYQGRGTPHWHIAAWVVFREISCCGQTYVCRGFPFFAFSMISKIHQQSSCIQPSSQITPRCILVLGKFQCVFLIGIHFFALSIL